MRKRRALRSSQVTAFEVEAVCELSTEGASPALAVTQLPPLVRLRPFIDHFRAGQRMGTFSEAIQIHDRSRRNGLRIVFELEPGSDPREFQERLLDETELRRAVDLDMRGYGGDGELVRTQSVELVRRALDRHLTELESPDNVRDALQELRSWSGTRRTRERRS